MARIAMIACLLAVSTMSICTAQEQDEKKGGKDWADHKGDIPFIVGYELGMAEVKFTGKPAMLFFTATW
ncbi:MAG: hypothetical protein ACI97A_003576 [Planctomycetota bacterium]|jgi:hypothetical protein